MERLSCSLWNGILNETHVDEIQIVRNEALSVDDYAWLYEDEKALKNGLHSSMQKRLKTHTLLMASRCLRNGLKISLVGYIFR